MRQVVKIQTRDGVLHDSPEDARRHADRVYGEALTRLAHRAVALDKYTKMVDFLDANLDAFVELKALKQDMEMENRDDD